VSLNGPQGQVATHSRVETMPQIVKPSIALVFRCRVSTRGTSLLWPHGMESLEAKMCDYVSKVITITYIYHIQLHMKHYLYGFNKQLFHLTNSSFNASKSLGS
jgi:hypothetical protein